MNVIEKNGRALLVIAPFVIALIVVWVIYDPFHMIGGKPLGRETAFAELPLWLWVIGIGILGSFLCYGILQAGRHPPAEDNITQQATDDLYRREEADRERQGLP
jgi:hypothetical protein